ncbi:ATP-grasp domain-containing protein [Pseudomonas putida]|uniref:ATP-grasp domain-containing protein n=1 Tax=Pseudomonas putida TaxID=303 RepID=UPI002FCD9D14
MIISVRSANGQISHYPLTTNVHVNGVLDTSVPGIAPELQEEAEAIVSKIIDHLDYVGVLAVKFFDVGGRLVVNEIAPRVHNSGHWTIEGAFCSQFENHLRAITALPLGDTGQATDCQAVIVIGQV